MDILRLAFKHDPKGAKSILSKINQDDNKISNLLKKLSKQFYLMNIIIGTAQLIKNYGIVKSYVGIKEFNKILKYSNSNKNNYIDTAIDYSEVDNILSKLNL